MKKYRLAFKDGKKQDYGPWIDSKYIVESWVKFLNNKYPNMSHWVEVKDEN